MKVLITGCFGLIGSRLTKIFLDKGYEVIGIDIGRNYLKFNQSIISNKLYLAYEDYRKDFVKNANIFSIDLKNGFEVLNLIKKEDPQLIIHLAALPLANLSFDVSQEAYTSIFGSTYNLLESIRICNPKIKFVFASSSMVYGNFIGKEAFESDPPKPISNYGAAKLSGEVLVRGFSSSYAISSLIIRPSAVYGPGDQNLRVLQKFIDQGFKKGKAKVNGKDLVLDFTYIDDICNGFFLAAEKLNSEEKPIFEIINCTSGDPVSLETATNLIMKYFPDLQVDFLPSDPRVPLRGGLNLKKAKCFLGYTPRYKFEEGLAEYINIERILRSK